MRTEWAGLDMCVEALRVPERKHSIGVTSFNPMAAWRPRLTPTLDSTSNQLTPWATRAASFQRNSSLTSRRTPTVSALVLPETHLTSPSRQEGITAVVCPITASLYMSPDALHRPGTRASSRTAPAASSTRTSSAVSTSSSSPLAILDSSPTMCLMCSTTTRTARSTLRNLSAPSRSLAAAG